MSRRVVWLIALGSLIGTNGCEEVARPRADARSVTTLDASQLTRLGTIEFIKGWELGRRVAAERGQPCLAFFTAPWCTYCKQMEASTFNDSRVAELASQFVCVMVDAESEPEICRRLHVSGFPTVQLISPAGLSLGRMAGLQAAPNFVKSLRAALERYAVLETRAVVR